MALNEYLDHLEGQGYLTVNRTAGLDMVYLKRKSGLRKLFRIIIKTLEEVFKRLTNYYSNNKEKRFVRLIKQ